MRFLSVNLNVLFTQYVFAENMLTLELNLLLLLHFLDLRGYAGHDVDRVLSVDNLAHLTF